MVTVEEFVFVLPLSLSFLPIFLLRFLVAFSSSLLGVCHSAAVSIPPVPQADPCVSSPAMTNLTFQITPDSNKDSETIQIGRDLKLSCHVDATPQDKVNYSWYKNGVPVFSSKSIIILRSDPELAPGTSSLEIVDMNFRDLATYSCVANFPGSRVPELRVDVNISQNGGEFLPRHVRHRSGPLTE